MSDNDRQRRSIEQDPEAMKLFVQALRDRLSTQQIVEKLERETGWRYNVDTVRRTRRRLLKSPDLQGIELPTPAAKPSSETPLTVPPSNLTDDQKAGWFRQQFKRSHLFRALKAQFDSDEVAAYLEEYGQVCCQFQDIVVSEFFQVDDFLKHRLLINRQLASMKNLQQEIAELNAWFKANPVKDDATPEEKKLRIENYRLLDGKHAALNKANERYDRLVAERQKIYTNLAATRRDRLDELKTGGDSFFSLLASIQASEKARQQHGKYAELTRIAAEDIHAEFRKSTTFPDGTRDVVILDDRTPESELDLQFHLDTDIDPAPDEMGSEEPL